MNGMQRRGRLLLWAHLFVCLVWLSIIRGDERAPAWMLHVFFWSILGIQFTWGYTIGLLVGPNRSCRKQLWWSLLLIFMPLYPLSYLFRFFLHVFPFPAALMYIGLIVSLLACQTFGGVLLGVRSHARHER